MDAGIGIGGLSTSKDEFVSSCFDLFSIPEIDNGIKKTYSQTFRPISSTSSKGPFTFVIPPDPNKFTDAESIRLHGAMRIRKNTLGTLTSLPMGEEVSTVNNIFNSIWSSINTHLNGTEITDPSGRWYAFKSYFENNLSYSTSSKKSILSSRGFFKDTAGKFDSLDVLPVPAGGGKLEVSAANSQNQGYLDRKELFSGSQWVYFCINLHTDITTLRKYIPPNVKISMELQRNSDEFCLLSPKNVSNFAIELKDLKIKLNRYLPSSKVMSFYEGKVKSGILPQLPIDRSLLKTYTVKSGTSDLSHYNIISGRQLPEQIIIGIIEETSHRGDITKNPFNFTDFGLMEASLIVNGVHEPSEPYRLDKSAGDKVDLYASFLENTGVSTDDREFGISMKDYYGGNLLLVWDRSPDKCNRYHRHEMDSGSIDVNLKTNTPLTNTVTVIIYATYSTDIQIDGENILISNRF